MAKVDVIMPCFNAAAWLDEAVASVRAQTLGDWRLLVVDDGSTDDVAAIVQRHASEDERVVLIRQDHAGLVAALNHGFAEASAPLVARMDADDLMVAERLACQCEFMAANPDVGVAGTAMGVFGPKGTYVRSYPQSPEAITAHLPFGFPFSHPSLMLRSEVLQTLDGPYREEWTYAEDYDFASRLLAVTKGANLPQVLHRYRLSETQITSVGRGPAAAKTRMARTAVFLDWFAGASAGDVALHNAVAEAARADSLEALDAVGDRLETTCEGIARRFGIDRRIVAHEADRFWWRFCRANTPLGTRIAAVYRTHAAGIGSSGAAGGAAHLLYAVMRRRRTAPASNLRTTSRSNGGTGFTLE